MPPQPDACAPHPCAQTVRKQPRVPRRDFPPANAPSTHGQTPQVRMRLYHTIPDSRSCFVDLCRATRAISRAHTHTQMSLIDRIPPPLSSSCAQQLHAVVGRVGLELQRGARPDEEPLGDRAGEDPLTGHGATHARSCATPDHAHRGCARATRRDGLPAARQRAPRHSRHPRASVDPAARRLTPRRARASSSPHSTPASQSGPRAPTALHAARRRATRRRTERVDH